MGRILCAIGWHDWRISKFFALGTRGPMIVCHRCGKVTHDD